MHTSHVVSGIAALTLSALTTTGFAQCPSQAAKTASSTCTADNAQMVSVGTFGDHKTIVETAVDAGSFDTLVAAVKAAGLVEALSGKGPFTVFAPTDDAFGKLPKGTIEALLKPENKELLKSILTYHVVPGRVTADKVVSMPGAQTLGKQWIDFSKNDGVKVDNANVVKTDIMCSNGVIHVIDAVIMPARDNAVTVASSAGMFNTLLTAATKAGLADTLANGGPFTIMAPTDDAFAKLPAGTIDSLLRPENKHQLAEILKFHVISGRVYSPTALEVGSADTLQGGSLHFAIRDGKPMVNDAKIIKTDIDASNAVIHVIDSVLLPKSD